MPPTQPYIYGVAPQDSFDPKAFTRASLAPPPPPKPKQQGPLIDFNKHPDSYLVRPYGQIDYKPMSPHTKVRIKRVRWVQLAVRAFGMIGALGLLVLVILISNVQDSDNYIVRVPPGIDVLTIAYALWHLSRPAKGRPPASSASYHFFALIIDVCLIPFYVFTVILVKQNLAMPVGEKPRWTSLLHNPTATNDILTATWLTAVSVSSLHVLGAAISLYLLIMFRKISELPPDMNPLEDNLTSRPSLRSRINKHKHKNSELSSASTLAVDNPSRLSLAQSNRESLMKEANVRERPISFLHTRTNSDNTYSPHNPSTAQASRSNLNLAREAGIYQQPPSARVSRIDTWSHDKETVLDSEAPSKVSHRFMSEPSSILPTSTMLSGSSIYSDEFVSEKSVPPVPRKSSKRKSLTSDNWFVCDSADQNANVSPAISVVDEELEGKESNKSFTLSSLSTFSKRSTHPSYQQVAQTRGDYRDVDLGNEENTPPRPKSLYLRPYEDHRTPLQPLAMNPPTPTASVHSEQVRNARNNASKTAPPTSRPLSTTSGNGSRGGTPTKQKYYGDLAAAVEGVRQSPQSSPSKNSAKKSRRKTGLENIDLDFDNDANRYPRGSSNVERRDWAGNVGGRRVDRKGRVISNTGAEKYLNADDNRVRGRNVSGKIAEEGRGGIGVWEIMRGGGR